MSNFVINIVQVQAIGSVVLLIGFLVATTLIQQRKSMQAASVLDDMSAAVTRSSAAPFTLAHSLSSAN